MLGVFVCKAKANFLETFALNIGRYKLAEAKHVDCIGIALFYVLLLCYYCI